MNVLRKILVGLGSLVAVALVLALAAPKTVHAIVSTLVTVVNTPANPVPVTLSTNGGLPLHNMVLLECISSTLNSAGTATCANFNQINPDGSTSHSPFAIPSGQTLVITDVTWTVNGCLFLSQTCQLSFETPPTSATFFNTGSLADANGLAIGSEHFTTGLATTMLPTVVSSGTFVLVFYTGYLTQ